jgi:hypothetical protein
MNNITTNISNPIVQSPSKMVFDADGGIIQETLEFEAWVAEDLNDRKNVLIQSEHYNTQTDESVFTSHNFSDPNEMLKMAAWLIQAARWMQQGNR